MQQHRREQGINWAEEERRIAAAAALAAAGLVQVAGSCSGSARGDAAAGGDARSEKLRRDGAPVRSTRNDADSAL